MLKTKFTNNFESRFNLAIALGLIGWVIFIFFYMRIMESGNYTRADINFSYFELFIDILIIYYSWKLYRIATELKIYFFLLMLSFVLCFLNDLDFTIVYIIYNITSPTSFLALTYFLPFLGYLILQLIFWFKITNSYIITSLKQKRGTLILFIIFNTIAMLLFLTASTWKFSPSSYLGIFMLVSSVIELFIFDLATIALICSKNKGFYLLSSAVIILIATNFWEKYLFLDQNLNVFDYSEFFWFLSIILSTYGLYYLVKKRNLEIRGWVRNIKGIKSQLSLWTFGVSVLSFLIFFILGYHFDLINQNSFLSLPFFVMIYSVIVILLTNFIGNKLEAPFKRLQENIEVLLNAGGNKELLNTDFHTEEFIFLQNFLTSTIQVSEEKNQIKQAIVDLSLQVAHDIRSPVAAILMLSKESTELPEDQRLSLRAAANRINDIANNMLSQYAGRSADNTQKAILASAAVLSVISEKKFQYKESPVQFNYECIGESYFAFINIDLIEFKRMISNLLNNAVEAIQKNGNIHVYIACIGPNVKITVKDNGKGIDPIRLNKIMGGEPIASDKTTGSGLGLTHARTVVKKYSADFEIQSELGKGTQVDLSFKKMGNPIWIANRISFSASDIIVVLDDDSSIHGAWDQIFSQYLSKCHTLKLIHFKYAEDCIVYLKGLSETDFTRVLLLTDFELIKQSLNGLDVIEITTPPRSILVSSHFENMEIIKRAICLKTKLLPKTLASEVKIELIESVKAEAKTGIDLIMLEDNREFSGVLSFLYETKGKKVDVYHEPYALLEALELYEKDITICLDYNIDCPVNGIDIGKALYNKGYTNLYLVTGYKMQQIDIPAYIKLLENKMDVLNL